MVKWMNDFRHYLERHGFYVSSRIGEKLGMKVKGVRLFFIYFSFATLGAGFAFYLIFAFLLKFKDLMYTKRSSVFDL